MSGAGGARSGVGDADVVGLHLAGVWLPTTLAPFARHSSGRYRCRRRRRCRCLLWPSLMYSFSRAISVSLFIHTTLLTDITLMVHLLKARHVFTSVI